MSSMWTQLSAGRYACQGVGQLAVALPGQRGSARVPGVELERAVHCGPCLARGGRAARGGEFPAGGGPDHVPAPPPSPSAVIVTTVPTGRATWSSARGSACAAVSRTGPVKAASSGGRRVASRICCWWTYRSMYSRATSSQTGARSEPVAHVTGPPAASRSSVARCSSKRRPATLISSMSKAGLIRRAASTHCWLKRLSQVSRFSPSPGPSPHGRAAPRRCRARPPAGAGDVMTDQPGQEVGCAQSPPVRLVSSAASSSAAGHQRPGVQPQQSHAP